MLTNSCVHLNSVETDFETKLKDLKERHQKETDGLETSDVIEEVAPPDDVVVQSTEESEKQRKQDKARRKREAKKEKERQRQLEIENAAAEAGPSARQIELEALESQLKPLKLACSRSKKFHQMGTVFIVLSLRNAKTWCFQKFVSGRRIEISWGQTPDLFSWLVNQGKFARPFWRKMNRTTRRSVSFLTK